MVQGVAFLLTWCLFNNDLSEKKNLRMTTLKEQAKAEWVKCHAKLGHMGRLWSPGKASQRS